MVTVAPVLSNRTDCIGSIADCAALSAASVATFAAVGSGGMGIEFGAARCGVRAHILAGGRPWREQGGRCALSQYCGELGVGLRTATLKRRAIRSIYIDNHVVGTQFIAVHCEIPIMIEPLDRRNNWIAVTTVPGKIRYAVFLRIRDLPMASMQPTSSASSEDLKQSLRVEQLRLIFDTQPFNIAASLVIAAIVAANLLPVTDSLRVLLWFGVMLVGNAVRAAIAIGWRRDPKRLYRTLYWWRYLSAASLIGGAGWGLGNFLLFPAQSPQQQMLLVFITCGISSAAAVSLAADRRIAWSFLIPCTLPLEWQLYTYSNGFGASLSAMGLVYLIFMSGVINSLHNNIKDNIMLRFTERERERLQNEFAQALHSSQEKLQALFELSPLGCLLTRSDGSFIEANQALLRMLGYSGTGFERFFSASLSSPASRDENRRRWRQLIQQGGTDALECEIVRQDGSLMPASVHRMVLDTSDGQKLVWSIVEDITERKQQGEQLQALNTRFSLATQAGNIGIWEVDLENNAALWDERMCEIYGIEPVSGPIPAEFAASLVHPDDWSRSRVAFSVAMNDATIDHHVFEYRVILDEGSERWIRLAGLFQRDEMGLLQRIIGVAWDITEIKRMERMKSEFVSTVSHELRTPLTSIRGSLGLATSGVVGEIPVAAQELIDIAYKNSERLSFLINDILDIEKIESGKMRIDLQSQTLRPLMQQVVAANNGFAQSFSVYLVLSVDTDAAVVIDANRFMQVMANLISNAVKFSSIDDSVEIVAMDTRTGVRIEVRDRGPGIPTDFHERIFQRFSQADSSDTRARGGSGLGLAITKALVEKMHGEIGFAARAGGGTVFFVELPRQ